MPGSPPRSVNAELTRTDRRRDRPKHLPSPYAPLTDDQRGSGTQVEPHAPTVWPEFDRVIHERLRLGIVSALAVNPSLTFTDLKNLLGTTDGNLSVHARKLEDAGYISCTKSFDGRVPRTDFSLTPMGRDVLETYLAAMETVIARTRQAGC